MRVAILGAGAMGQLFGGRLAADGNDVVFIDVDDKTIEALNRDGVTINTPASEIFAPAFASRADNVEGGVDLLLVFTKGFHTADAIASIQHLVGEKTIGLTLQNGLGNDKWIRPLFDEGRFLAGVTDYPADRKSTNRVETSESGHIIIGHLMETSVDQDPGLSYSAAEFVASVFNSAGLITTVSADVRVAIWEKVVFNTVMNTVGAAASISVGETGSSADAKRLSDLVLEESLAVAEAIGIGIVRSRVVSMLEDAYSAHSEHRTSMTVDVEERRRTEIDSIGGAVEKIGFDKGIATPTLSTLCSIIRLRSCSS